MKLTLEHSAPYLPWSPTIIFDDGETMTLGMEDAPQVVGIKSLIDCIFTNNPKLALRPLSDLYKPIDEGEDVSFWDWMQSEFGVEYDEGSGSWLYKGEETETYELPHHAVEYLYEHLFDVKGLIVQRLAIDINTI